MAIPSDRQSLLTAIEINFAKLMDVIEAIPTDRVGEATMEGHSAGSQISVRDAVTYLVGWNELVLKWQARREAGEAVDFPETGYRWDELGRLAGKFYRDYDDLPYPELIDRLRRAKNDIVALISAQSDQSLYGEPWYGKWPLGRMIQLNTSSPYANTRARLQKWRKAEGLA
ncbi:MAG: ClbS/DfsB family four-helix bundle protein [Rhizobiales bacterium]|mgnify:CR=1 FL=1|nr:ClbS/DfsB family four-helix bundle protein [Hyphomicrobiales bacterium]